jgi:hypothetical protein
LIAYFINCLAGQKLVSNGFSHRFLAAVWCLTAVVLASAYVGVLVSFLRFPKLTTIINKLEELPDSQLKWAVLRGTALEMLFSVNERNNTFAKKIITCNFCFAGSNYWSLQDHWRLTCFFCISR